jgi:hypothetical protein
MGRCTTGELQCIFRLDPVALAIDTQAIAK